MKLRSLFPILMYAADLLIISSLLLVTYGGIWEYSTRRYLAGFSDAIVPYAASPEQKVQAILGWMLHSQRRNDSPSLGDLDTRDPEVTLNDQELLYICGTATNAFVNLARSSGLEARRLLLLTPGGVTKHVVAEVHIDGRWVVVDPTFHQMWRDPSGRLLTRQQLADPKVFREAIQNVPGYDLQYDYALTTHVRLAAIPLIGRSLGNLLDRRIPQWGESADWTLLVERESFAVLITGICLLLVSLLFRRLINRYGAERFGITPKPLREQLQRSRWALLGIPSD